MFGLESMLAVGLPRPSRAHHAEEATELIDIEYMYPLDACQCDSNNVCVDDNNLVDSFLRRSDSLKLCIRFKNVNGLPPAYGK